MSYIFDSQVQSPFSASSQVPYRTLLLNNLQAHIFQFCTYSILCVSYTFRPIFFFLHHNGKEVVSPTPPTFQPQWLLLSWTVFLVTFKGILETLCMQCTDYFCLPNIGRWDLREGLDFFLFFPMCLGHYF